MSFHFLPAHGVGWSRAICRLEAQLAALEGVRIDGKVRRKSIKALSERIDALESECDSLKVYVAALIRILIEHGIATEQNISAAFDAIDLEDGFADGRNDTALPKKNLKSRRNSQEPPIPPPTPCEPTAGVRLRPRHRR